MQERYPIPENEMERIIELSDFDLDYSELEENLADLTKLAAKVAGTSISLVNLIDSFTQWSVSTYGFDIQQMKREDSICQYTIVTKEAMEVKDLSSDNRFKNNFYVKDNPNLRYYLGIPLQTENGHNLGALCVMDTVGKEISAEKVEMLKIIANEIVERLLMVKQIQALRNIVVESKETQRKLTHDIRGPLSGIVGLADLIREQGPENKMEDVLQLVSMIYKGGNSLLELADDILSNDKRRLSGSTSGSTQTTHTLDSLKESLEKLFAPQAMNKHVTLNIQTVAQADKITFPRNKLIQIIGNLISNAIKFTPANGLISVELGFTSGLPRKLKVVVKDTGDGMDEETIQQILDQNNTSTTGTNGEMGYGFGLKLVQHLTTKLGGSLVIHSEKEKGSSFEVLLPF